MIEPDYNFASWYSTNRPKEVKRPWIINGKISGYVDLPFERIRQSISLINMRGRVNMIQLRDGAIYNFISKNHAMMTVLLGSDQGSIEIASYDALAILSEATRIKLPAKGLEVALKI